MLGPTRCSGAGPTAAYRPRLYLLYTQTENDADFLQISFAKNQYKFREFCAELIPEFLGILQFRSNLLPVFTLPRLTACYLVIGRIMEGWAACGAGLPMCVAHGQQGHSVAVARCLFVHAFAYGHFKRDTITQTLVCTLVKCAAHRSMAPLSLLGTVVRDKMMKTVTVQVNAHSHRSIFDGVSARMLHAHLLISKSS